jgi:hypothetical protein
MVVRGSRERRGYDPVGYQRPLQQKQRNWRRGLRTGKFQVLARMRADGGNGGIRRRWLSAVVCAVATTAGVSRSGREGGRGCRQ